MSLFTQKLRTFAVAAVGSAALLLGSCVTAPQGSKRPLGPPADVATHAPELIGMWALTQNCGHEPEYDMVQIFKTDGFGAVVYGVESNYEHITTSDGKHLTKMDIVDRGFEWSTDESVLFNVTNNEVWGDYVVSEDTLRIKYRDKNCTQEYTLITRDVTREVKVERGAKWK